MGLLKTIAILIIVYYIFRFFSRYIAPIFLKKVIDKAEEKFREQQQYQQPKKEGNVGETVIDKKAPFSKEGSKEVGEYIDYEDVNE